MNTSRNIGKFLIVTAFVVGVFSLAFFATLGLAFAEGGVNCERAANQWEETYALVNLGATFPEDHMAMLEQMKAWCAPATEPAAEAEVKAEAEPTPAPKAKPATYASNDVALGRKLAAAITSGAREQQCLLVTVVASEQSYSRDLSVFSRSDLAAGALVSADAVYNEAGAVSAIVGLNAQIELKEDNSVDVFGKRVYVSYAAKAAGKGLDAFTTNAAKAGFLVTQVTAECNSTTRLSDLTKVAKAHVEQLRKEAALKAAIASR